MPQVVPVDGQHLVVVAQLAILGRQPACEQVQDEDARLVRLADELDAQRLGALALGQRHLGDGALGVVLVRSTGMVVKVVGGLRRGVGRGRGGGGQVGGVGARRRVLLEPWLEAFLLHDGDPEQGARAAQHTDGTVMAHGRQAGIVHLGDRDREEAGG